MCPNEDPVQPKISKFDLKKKEGSDIGLENLGDLTLKDEDKEEECGAQQGAFVRETRNWGSRNCESGRTGGTLSNTRANSNACREEDCGRGKRATSP